MKRFWNALANGLYYLLWAGAVVSIVYVFGRALLGCSRVPPLTPDQAAIAAAGAACAKDIGDEIALQHDCPEAQLAINAKATCRLAFPKGVDLDCPEFRGGR